MSYTGLTENDRKEMLQEIGVSSTEDLFVDIPESIRLKDRLNIPHSLTELEISQHINEIKTKNKKNISFLGAGAYNHFIPAAVDALSGRSEFYTAYTPYQPEVSQGTLTAIFEYQSIMSQLTGMAVSNASMYDGATALAESILMAARSNRKTRFIISDAIHPNYRDVLKTYAWAGDINLVEIKSEKGITPIDKIIDAIDENTSAVIIQSPNFFGVIEDIEKISEIVHDKKTYLIMNIVEALSLAILNKPGDLGADIVCGEAQSFGNPIGYGGPMLGFISATKEFLRKMPGRLVGKSEDADGKEAYVLTLQTREQHIRRERATSNICSNQGLCALRAVIYLALHGNKLRDLAMVNHKSANYLRDRLKQNGFADILNKPFFNEFVMEIDNAQELLTKLKAKGYTGGLYLGDYHKEFKDRILFCATEMNSKEDIDQFLDGIRECI